MATPIPHVPGPADDSPLRFLPPRVHGLAVVLPRMLRDPLGALREYSDQYGGVVALTRGKYYLVTAPDLVKHVLRDNHFNYVKGPRYQLLTPVIGDSLINTDGEAWKRQRRIVQPLFYRKHHPAVQRAIARETSLLLDQWEGFAQRHEPVFARAHMVQLTLNILLHGFFGSGLEGKEESVAAAILAAKGHINLVKGANPVNPPLWMPTPANRRFHAAVRTLDAFVYEVIARRRATGAEGDDLVSTLVSARDEESGEGLDDKQIRDVLVGLISAAHETTSDSLFWTWYLLSKHPDAQRRLEDEVDRVLGSSVPGADDVDRLTFLNGVLSESMRMYPPAWLFSRLVVEDDSIGGYRIPAGANVILSPWVTHNLKEYWPSPHVFEPDRFMPGHENGRPLFAYFPFGGGPRQCVGTTLAMLELPIILAMVAQRFRLEATTDGVGLHPHVSLGPDRPVLFRLHRRDRPGDSGAR